MCLRKMDINHVNENNRYAMHFINYQLISISETTTGESAASALERLVSLTTFNKDYCVLSVCDFLSVSFVAVSYLTVTYHLAYKTLSHVYYFKILGGVKLAYVVSTTRCIYTCLVSSGMRPRPPLKWFEQLDLYPTQMHFRWHLHLVFSGSDSYPIRQNE